MDGMEALGEAIEKGEVPMEEENRPEDWEEERKRMNCEGEEEVIKKWEPVPVTRELEEKVMGRKEDEALLESESESEVPELVESEESGEEENGEEEENEENENEEENEDEEEVDEEEEENDNSDNEDNKTSKATKEEKEAAEAKEREEVRQRRIAMARKVLSTRVLTPKDYRILNGDESSSEEEVEVANAMVALHSLINRSITTRWSILAICWDTRRRERTASRWERNRG